ncbi:MAG: heme-binding protein [Gemmataceae bacterium]|nr:heme-binding protein [Gemmataceae bacterium]
MPVPTPLLGCEHLEHRDTPATATLDAGGVLSVLGTPADDRLTVYLDAGRLVVLDGTAEVGRFDPAAVRTVTVDAGGGRDVVKVTRDVTRPVMLVGDGGPDKLAAGGGDAVLVGGPGGDALFGGGGSNAFDGGPGRDRLFNVREGDIVIPDGGDTILAEISAAPAVTQTLTTEDVQTLLRRAAAASASTDAIIAITDRNGTILGVRVESGVSPTITGSNEALVFAVDGAVSLARTGAFFGNDQAPLTSRTVQFISQSTITQREVESNPNVPDPNSTLRGPGFVAPVNIAGHFPPGIALTPQVDLFQIEHTNRDGSVHPGADHVRGTADDIPLRQRFNLDPAFVPAGKGLVAPDSYGVVSGKLPNAQSRGVATLPGGIPVVKNGEVVGGIGVFFPGETGFATAENSSLSFLHDPTKPDRTLEAEWIAYAAVGGTGLSLTRGIDPFPVNEINGVPLPAGIRLPTGRIDLVGITLDIFGPGGKDGGVVLQTVGAGVGRGDPNEGQNLPVTPGGATVLPGRPVPDGWLVVPHDGDGLTRADVERIVTQGIAQSNLTRAAIRLPPGTRARFVFAVADRQGNIVGLYREPDATVFSIDVAVAKARNVAYYADPAQLQPVDQIPGVPAGVAFTNRTFRYAGLPRFPEGIDGSPPGPFSQLNDDPGTSRTTGLQVGPRLPASAYQSAVGFDAFNPGTNFHQVGDVANQNGVVFFPGSAPVYRAQAAGGLAVLAGGFGVSGDGVDQDDVATVAGQAGFDVPSYILRADQVFVRGVRLPYQKFNRNPEG